MDDVGARSSGDLLRRAAAVFLALSAILGAVGATLAQAPPSGAAGAQPSPPSERPASAPPAGTGSSACPPRPLAGISDAADVLVTLGRDSLWRPRGGEVQFRVTSKAGTTVAVQRVQVCMGWSSPRGTPPDAPGALVAAPLVRPIATDAAGALFGAEVPDLRSPAVPWFHPGAPTEVAYTAFYTVPLADMVVVVTLAGGETATVLIPVGVTSVVYAVVVVALCVAGFFRVGWLLTRRDPRFVLEMISSPDGVASLSQFQILLWTVTVGASAVYVMVLSGNLIDLTDGTLVLLGIAGGVALTSRIAKAGVGAARDPAGAAPVARGVPRWSDLVTANGGVDLTRMQMLAFTLISAAFVTLKVISGYVIPEIPLNFLLLMGISNGIYVVGARYPDRAAAG